jgi:hypothetical protein
MFTGISIEIDHEQKSALRLWRAVINQAVADSFSEKRHDRVGVSRWLLSKDFETVCDFASFDPRVIKRCIAEILMENGSVRAEVLGKRMITELEEV